MTFTFVFSDDPNAEGKAEEISFADLQAAIGSAADALAEIVLEKHSRIPSEMTVTIKEADVSKVQIRLIVQINYLD